MTNITTINPDNLAPLPGPAHVVVAEGGRTIYVSGQTGVDLDGKVVGADHRSQSLQALRNLETALAAAGASLSDVVRLGIFIVDYSDEALGALVEAALEVGNGSIPSATSTLLGVASLWQPDVLIEIDAVAVV
ncbi:MAG: yabJ [Acidimicrobiales bacterium]|nr:yabJ [Acidimicrobiales bacterium]